MLFLTGLIIRLPIPRDQGNYFKHFSTGEWCKYLTDFLLTQQVVFAA